MSPDELVTIQETGTEPVSSEHSSNLLNYADYYEKWDYDEYWEECRSCWGTGLDDDEIYDCSVCGGEGEVRYFSDISSEVPLTPTDGAARLD